MNWYLDFFKQSFNFNDKAGRKDYIFFCLISFGIYLIFLLLQLIIFFYFFSDIKTSINHINYINHTGEYFQFYSKNFNYNLNFFKDKLNYLAILMPSNIFLLISFLAFISLTFRRLNDSGYSNKIFIYLIFASFIYKLLALHFLHKNLNFNSYIIYLANNLNYLLSFLMIIPAKNYYSRTQKLSHSIGYYLIVMTLVNMFFNYIKNYVIKVNILDYLDLVDNFNYIQQLSISNYNDFIISIFNLSKLLIKFGFIWLIIILLFLRKNYNH